MLKIAVLLPILCGLAALLVGFHSRRLRELYLEGVTLITSVIVFIALATRQGQTETFLRLTQTQALQFRLDGVGSLFATIVAFLWPLAMSYAFEYMQHEGHGENHFLAIYLMTYGVTLGITFAGSLLTMYVFYEFLTLVTLPLVMHGTSKESVSAGRMYMIYSFCGAAAAFVGVMIVTACGNGGAFTMNGVLGEAFKAEHPWLLQLGYLCCFFGFGVKAAIFPLHAWLPAASVAPTPVTALLHAVAVVKAGVFAVIRVTYFSFGAALLRGTPAQGIAIGFAAATIVFGSTMAVREHHFKRRLAYSTVSNLSYILLAASFMTPEGLTAGMTHMLFHALIKITLFFCAGAVMVCTGRTMVENLRGLGKHMPVVCGVYALGAVALSGTPGLPAFVSKWLIGTAALSCGHVIAIVGLAALLISAVLTAIYVLSPVFFMFFRQEDEKTAIADGANVDPGLRMKIPLFILSAAILFCGLFSNRIVTLLAAIAAGVM